MALPDLSRRRASTEEWRALTMGVLFDDVADADDIEGMDMTFTHEMRRTLSLGVVTLPVPPRMGSGPWHVHITADTNGILKITRPDEYEVTIKVRMRRQSTEKRRA